MALSGQKERAIKLRFLAFLFVAAGTLGSMAAEAWGWGEGAIVDGLVIGAIVCGLGLWLLSKRAEGWRPNRRRIDEEER